MKILTALALVGLWLGGSAIVPLWIVMGPDFAFSAGLITLASALVILVTE
jgi:hypothetical protein